MEQEKRGLEISKRSFLLAIGIIFVLMLLTYILTLVIPGGEYARSVNEAGNTVLDAEAGFREVPVSASLALLCCCCC